MDKKALTDGAQYVHKASLHLLNFICQSSLVIDMILGPQRTLPARAACRATAQNVPKTVKKHQVAKPAGKLMWRRAPTTSFAVFQACTRWIWSSDICGLLPRALARRPTLWWGVPSAIIPCVDIYVRTEAAFGQCCIGPGGSLLMVERGVVSLSPWGGMRLPALQQQASRRLSSWQLLVPCWPLPPQRWQKRPQQLLPLRLPKTQPLIRPLTHCSALCRCGTTCVHEHAAFWCIHLFRLMQLPAQGSWPFLHLCAVL